MLEADTSLNILLNVAFWSCAHEQKSLVIRNIEDTSVAFFFFLFFWNSGVVLNIKQIKSLS